MSVLAGKNPPSVAFKTVGDSVAGRITGFEDYQETEYGSNPPVLKTYTKSGDPVMATRIYLDTEPGGNSNIVTLYCQGKKLQTAVASAFTSAGRKDLVIGDDLAVTFTGYDGKAKTYAANYVVADTEVAKAEVAEDEAPF